MAEIKHTTELTTEHTRHPWPEGMFIQGGKSGVVFNNDGSSYRTAFVEAFPDTFLRGEGATIAEAEDACWAKYQHLISCPAHPQHGPFEARNYTNGAGFCTQCGAWFSKVCEPSIDYKINAVACDRVTAKYGRDVVITGKWRGLVADEEARIRAELAGEPRPEPTTEQPTAEELAEAAEPLDLSALGSVLTALANKTKETEE